MSDNSKKKIKCPDCNGTGTDIFKSKTFAVACTQCGGSGDKIIKDETETIL